MLGYHGDPEATRAAFTDDGFFRTGDLGVTRADGGFEFLLRSGDVLRLAGYLVSPMEIEEIVARIPSGHACQVVAVPMADLQRLVAFVMLNVTTNSAGDDPDFAARIDSEVRAHCASRLARYKVPARVAILDSFPTTEGANGVKVQKSVLREWAEALVAETPVRVSP